MFNWLFNVINCHNRKCSALEYAHNGIYRVWGDPRPLYPKILKMKDLLEEGNDVRDNYFELLEKINCMTLRPLDSQYEAKVLPPDYIEFKKYWEKDGPVTFERMITKDTLVAIVKVVSGNSRFKSKCKVIPIQVFNGEFPSDGLIGVMEVRGYEDGWFIKGEVCLILCEWYRPELHNSGGPRFRAGPISSGPNGRLPFDDTGKYILSFSPNEEYWINFPSYIRHGINFVEWEPVRRYLSTLNSKVQ